MSGQASSGAAAESYGSVPWGAPTGDTRSLFVVENGLRTLVAGYVDVYADRRSHSLPFAMVRSAEGVLGPLRAFSTEADAFNLDAALPARIAMLGVSRADGYRVLATDAAQNLVRIDLDATGAMVDRGATGLRSYGAIAALALGPDTVGANVDVTEGASLTLFTLDAGGALVAQAEVSAPDEQSYVASSPRMLATGENEFLLLYEAGIRSTPAEVDIETRVRSFRCER